MPRETCHLGNGGRYGRRAGLTVVANETERNLNGTEWNQCQGALLVARGVCVRVRDGLERVHRHRPVGAHGGEGEVRHGGHQGGRVGVRLGLRR